MSSFQDPKHQTENPYSKILTYKANLAHFRTIILDRNGKMNSFQDPNWQVLKRNKISSFQDLLSRPLREPMVRTVI